MSAGSWGKQGGGSYGFENGHMLLWTQWANPEDRPNFPKADEYTEKYGEAMSKWMIERSRNLCLYPNVYLMDQFGSQIRVLRPLSSIELKSPFTVSHLKVKHLKLVHVVSVNMKISLMLQAWQHQMI
jgi:phenylpropionate dioxygenase-like ring-hydroxylating dioxygenase large terminal subunit